MDACPSPIQTPGSKFFQFHAVFGNIWQNLMLALLHTQGLAPPPRGNLGSVTEIQIQIRKTKTPRASCDLLRLTLITLLIF